MSSGWGVGDEDHGVDYPVNRTYVPAATEIEDELDGLPDPSPQRDGWSAMAPTAGSAPAQPMAQGGSWDDGHDIGVGDMGRSSDKDFSVYSNDTFVPAAAGQESQHSSAGAWDDPPIAFHDSGLSNQFVSGRMQTGGASTSASEGQQLVQGQSSASPGAGEDEEGDQKMPWWARWSGLSFLSQYFDIDTPDVLWRCSNSVVGVMNPNFLEATQQSPDLYGPFWVTTTLVFVTAMAGNFASYLEYVRNGSKEDDKDDIDPWRVDISKLSWSAFVFYFYVFGIGTGMFLLLKFAKVEDASLVKSWCLYGYAMTIFVPVALLSVLPLFWVRVLLVGTATLLSGGFLLRNFRAAIQDAYASRALAIMAGAAALHISLMIVLLFYFFKY